MIHVKPAAGGHVDITFVLAEPPPGHTSVVGSFNDWEPGRHRLVRRSNGTWSTSVRVVEGATVCFRYLATDDRWFGDADVDLPHDDRGQLIAV